MRLKPPTSLTEPSGAGTAAWVAAMCGRLITHNRRVPQDQRCIPNVRLPMAGSRRGCKIRIRFHGVWHGLLVGRVLLGVSPHCLQASSATQTQAAPGGQARASIKDGPLDRIFIFKTRRDLQAMTCPSTPPVQNPCGCRHNPRQNEKRCRPIWAYWLYASLPPRYAVAVCVAVAKTRVQNRVSASPAQQRRP